MDGVTRSQPITPRLRSLHLHRLCRMVFQVLSIAALFALSSAQDGGSGEGSGNGTTPSDLDIVNARMSERFDLSANSVGASCPTSVNHRGPPTMNTVPGGQPSFRLRHTSIDHGTSTCQSPGSDAAGGEGSIALDLYVGLLPSNVPGIDTIVTRFPRVAEAGAFYGREPEGRTCGDPSAPGAVVPPGTIYAFVSPPPSGSTTVPFSDEVLANEAALEPLEVGFDYLLIVFGDVNDGLAPACILRKEATPVSSATLSEIALVPTAGGSGAGSSGGNGSAAGSDGDGNGSGAGGDLDGSSEGAGAGGLSSGNEWDVRRIAIVGGSVGVVLLVAVVVFAFCTARYGCCCGNCRKDDQDVYYKFESKGSSMLQGGVAPSRGIEDEGDVGRGVNRGGRNHAHRDSRTGDHHARDEIEKNTSTGAVSPWLSATLPRTSSRVRNRLADVNKLEPTLYDDRSQVEAWAGPVGPGRAAVEALLTSESIDSTHSSTIAAPMMTAQNPSTPNSRVLADMVRNGEQRADPGSASQNRSRDLQ